MGISGLLPFVKNALRQGNIQELRSKSVAVDVSCLLHRGLTGCMDKIHMGEDTQSYVHYVERYIKELIAMNCHVVMVFDGRPLPAKKQTNDDRRDQRDKNMQHAELLLAKGFEKEARDKFRLATKISTDIVETTIDHFRSWKNVDIVVAPYEADAQLAYLVKAKLVDAVITEDSDLIVFGCEKIYFKWQCGTGECSIYERSNLKNCFTGELGGDKFDFIKFRRICILSGCDYLQAGLPGVGLSTAVKFFGKTSISDIRLLLKKIPAYLNNPKLKSHITEEFIDSFIKAENTFLYQVVFDPKERCQRPLNSYPKGEVEVSEFEIDDIGNKLSTSSSSNDKKYDYAGSICTQKISIRLALGNKADGAAINDKFLSPPTNPPWSVWSEKYESKGTISSREEREKESAAMVCGGAFKLDAPSVKKVKKSESSTTVKSKVLLGVSDEDDLVKQFIEDVEKEKVSKKRKNAPDNDYSAESLMAKYGSKKMKQETVEKVKHLIEDDFDEIFEIKTSEKIQTTKMEETSEIVLGDEVLLAETAEKITVTKKTKVVENTDLNAQNSVLRPPPIVRKLVSSPAVGTQVKMKKFQSPILAPSKSLPTTSSNGDLRPKPQPDSPFPVKSKTLGQSKYFANKGAPKMSNPFRCPAFVKPVPSENKEPENNGVLGRLDNGDSETKKKIAEESQSSISSYRYVGFKNAGLRRKSTTNK